jgi:hypothetical protein
MASAIPRETSGGSVHPVLVHLQEIIEAATMRNSRVVFDEVVHKYTVDGEGGYVSVTGIGSQQFPPFNPTIISGSMAKNPDNLKKNPKYAEIAKIPCKFTRARSIREMWLRDSDLGTALHAFAEDRWNRNSTETEPIDHTLPKEYIYASMFINSLIEEGYKLFGAEVRLFDVETKLAGTADLVVVSPAGVVVLIDMKRCGKVTKRGGAKGLTRHTRHMKGCNSSLHHLQLNLYRWMINKNYGLNVEEMMVVNCHPTNGGYMIHKIKKMDKLVNGIMADRLREISAPTPPVAPVSPISSDSSDSSDEVELVPTTKCPPRSRTTKKRPNTVSDRWSTKKSQRRTGVGGETAEQKDDYDGHPRSLAEKRMRDLKRSGQWISKHISPTLYDDIKKRQEQTRKENNPKLHEFKTKQEILSYIIHRKILDAHSERYVSKNRTVRDVTPEEKAEFLKVHLVAMWKLLDLGEENNDAVREYMRAHKIQGHENLNSSIRNLYIPADHEAKDAKYFEIDDIADPRSISEAEKKFLAQSM